MRKAPWLVEVDKVKFFFVQALTGFSRLFRSFKSEPWKYEVYHLSGDFPTILRILGKLFFIWSEIYKKYCFNFDKYLTLVHTAFFVKSIFEDFICFFLISFRDFIYLDKTCQVFSFRVWQITNIWSNYRWLQKSSLFKTLKRVRFFVFF